MTYWATVPGSLIGVALATVGGRVGGGVLVSGLTEGPTGAGDKSESVVDLCIRAPRQVVGVPGVRVGGPGGRIGAPGCELRRLW